MNLPLPLLGIFGARTLPADGAGVPWRDELEHHCLAEKIGIAPYSEVQGSPSSGTAALLSERQ